MSALESEMDQEDSNVPPEFNEEQVRQKYRELREEMNDERQDCVNTDSDRLEKIMDRVEQTFKSVKNPREAVSDSNALHELAVLGTERIKNLKCAFRQFNNIEFMNKLKGYMSDQAKINKSEPSNPDSESDEDMETESKKYVLTKPIITAFGTNCLSYFKILPRPKFLIGSLEKELILSKKQVVRQRKERRVDEELQTKIKELDVNSKEHEDNSTVSETERIVIRLRKIFKKTKKNPICLYGFVINPHSFSRTIENIFYVSFLVKDGYATIYLDGDELPVIEPVDIEKIDSKSPASKKTNNIQSMISLNKLQWKELIEVFEITKPMISDPK